MSKLYEDLVANGKVVAFNEAVIYIYKSKLATGSKQYWNHREGILTNYKGKCKAFR